MGLVQAGEHAACKQMAEREIVSLQLGQREVGDEQIDLTPEKLLHMRGWLERDA